MPMSLKCMIDKWLHKGQISQEEYDAVMKKLDGHDRQIREEGYKQGKVDGAREFAEWLPQHFDLRFSNNPDVWIDEFFNHTRDKVLAEWQKGAENE